MRPGSPRWDQLNRSPYRHEQAGLELLREYLPDASPYHVWANVEFVGSDGSINEIDALVLAPSGLYLLELKHWEGDICGNGIHWQQRHPSGRTFPKDNPLIAANRKARRIRDLMRHYGPERAHGPFVQAAVFMHAKTSQSTLDAIGRQHVYGLDGREAFSRLSSVKDLLTQPSGKVDASRGRQIVELINRCGFRPSTAERRVDGLILAPDPFSEGPGWQDFLAEHAKQKSVQRRVRIYLSSRVPDNEAAAIRRAAEREFSLLQGIHHPGIARASNIVDHALGPAVIFDHIQGSVRFDQWLAQNEARLTFAQRLQLLDELAQTMDYAHARRLAHRGLYPRAVLVSEPDAPQPSLVITDWHTAGRLASTTSFTSVGGSSAPDDLEMLVDDSIRRYQAPEAAFTKDQSGVRLDVFGLGAIAYRLFTGQDPGAGPQEMRDRGLNISDAADAIPQQLVDLVFDATFADPRERISTIKEFRARIDDVWNAATAPDPEPVIDPLRAKKGDRLDNGLEVLSQLGSGATSIALLVREGGETSRELVLKVARDVRHAERFAAEAAVLSKLNDSRVVTYLRDAPVGGLPALLMERAGLRTLAEDLQRGRLALGLLIRFGNDLLDILSYLDLHNIWHRDIKPSNLAIREVPKDRELHLRIFDFSLTDTPADNLNAGTRPYLDPFLGGAKRPRYDSDAERFAAAVTLFEMATGKQPSWGDANPATVSDEVTLNPEDFDRAYADALVEFFRTALARDARARYDTTAQLAEAWRAVFRRRQPTVTQRPMALTRESSLTETGLTDGARSALEERLGIHTVGALLDYSPFQLISAPGITDAAKKEIRAERHRLSDLLPDADEPELPGVGLLSAMLLKGIKDPKETNALAVILGQTVTAQNEFLSWPSPREAEKHTRAPAAQLSFWLSRQAKRWHALPAFEKLRDELVSIVEAHSGIMSAEELALSVLASHGSTEAGAKRLPQAVGLVRAAVMAELVSGGDARLDHSRGDAVVLIGREPGSGHTASELFSYVEKLGQRATALLATEDLSTRRDSVEALRTIPVPYGFPQFEESRLLQLAAAVSPAADLNAQGQFYPVDLDAERAIRLAAGSLNTQRLTVDNLRTRIRARFPKAQPLPPRPLLDRLLEKCDIPLIWSGTEYVAKGTALVPTRTGSTAGSPMLPADAAHAQSVLEQTLRRKTFLAVLTRMRDLTAMRQQLTDRFGLTEVNITAIMLRQLRGTGIPWELLVAADTGQPGDADFKSLADLVKHKVMPEIRAALDTEEPVLITEAAPLVRYGQLGLIAELADTSRPHPAARLLLVPGGRPEPAMIEKAQIPLPSPTTQAIWLPVAWKDSSLPVERTSGP